MTATNSSKFWRDIETAYNQVAANHEREVVITSEAEDLTATVEYDSIAGKVNISVYISRNESEARHSNA
jgi:hypothetical protein